MQAEDIADIAFAGLKELGRMKWTDIYTDLQEHVAMGSILKKERVVFGSGSAIQWQVMTNNTGAARRTGLYEPDSVNVGDVLQNASIPWRHVTTNYAFDERELTMNASPAKIVDLLKVRRADAMISLAELMEDLFWDDPEDDNLSPFGIPYWIVKDTSTAGGFNGGNPTNFSGGAGGLDSSTYTNWKNWAGAYSEVNKTDFVRRARKAATFTKFKSPVPQPQYFTGDRYGYYTNYNVIQGLEELLEQQNDNLGNDVASKDGQVLFRRNPVIWTPKLEADTSDPFYGINWGTLRVAFLRGEYLKQMRPMRAPLQHRTMQAFIDLTWNVLCRDRRRNFVLSKAP